MLTDRNDMFLINDPSMQGLNINMDLGGSNFRRNNNTLMVDEGGGGFDTIP